MDKVWLIIGRASGLGRNIAEAVLESGDRLQPLRSTRRRFGRRGVELDGQAESFRACRHSSESSDSLSASTGTPRAATRRQSSWRLLNSANMRGMALVMPRSSRPVPRHSGTVLPTRRLGKQCGSTRNFRHGATTRVIQRRPSLSITCWMTLPCTG